jgi:FtsZ-interacting cell division protein ZipA
MSNPTVSFGWILLSVGLAIFFILLVKPIWNKQRHQSKIKINNKFIINNNHPKNEKSRQIITLRFSPKIKSNFHLKEIKELFLSHNLSFNEMKIFERKDGDKELYNVANLIEPGIFEKNRDIPGFTFFFQQTDPKTDLHILNEMFDTMHELCKRYDAWILDDNGKNINRDNLNNLITLND